MSSLALIAALSLIGTTVFAASVRIEDAPAAEAYVDLIFVENDCQMSFAQIDTRMRDDGIIPTPDEMASDVGVTKLIRQRRVMGALERLFTSGELTSNQWDKNFTISNFGGMRLMLRRLHPTQPDAFAFTLANQALGRSADHQISRRSPGVRHHPASLAGAGARGLAQPSSDRAHGRYARHGLYPGARSCDVLLYVSTATRWVPLLIFRFAAPPAA